jgi:hypothetical protein
MKSKKAFCFLISILVFGSIVGCDSEDLPLVKELTISERMTSGTWKISTFTYKGVNKTIDYSGVSFDFDAISVALNNTGTLPVAGGWSVIDEGFEGAPELVFILTLTSVEPRFTSISDDWKIISSSNSELKLKDENLETGDIDYLTFIKN